MSDFLHNHSDFSGLLAIVADERGIDPVLDHRLPIERLRLAKAHRG